jgi:RNA polymerase sigma-70 factor (ECF subfamily)
MAVDLKALTARWPPRLRIADLWQHIARPLFMARQTPPSSEDDGTPSVVPPTPSAAEVDAFYELFSRYQKPIADFLYRMTHDRDWAADLTQDTFLKAYAHIEDLKSIANVRAWLYRIAANTASNALRHQRRFAWVSLTEMRTGDSSSSSGQSVVLAASGDLATSVVERDELVNALQSLPPTARAAILLRATGGFEAHEIASMLNITEANARKILYRAKEKLRKALTPPTTTKEALE